MPDLTKFVERGQAAQAAVDEAIAAAAPPEPASVQEVWTYLGMRTERGEVEHHWRDERGDVKVFHKMKAPMAGSRYRLEVTRKADGSVAVVPNPRFVDQVADDDERRAIIAEHRANETALEAWRLAKTETATAIDAMTIGALRKKMNRLPVTRRRALLAIAIDRLQNGKVD